MNIRGKIKSQEEFNYIQNVIRMSGRSEKEFIRAATLTYCDFLLKRAEELRTEAKNKEAESREAVNESADTDRDSKEQGMDEALGTTALANT